MAANGANLVSAIAVTNQQIAFLATDIAGAQDIDSQQRIANEEAALLVHRSSLQDQLRSKGDRQGLAALARGRVEAEIARDVDNVITEEFANDPALIDPAGDRQQPKNTTNTNIGGGVKDAVRQVSELLARTGLSSGLEAFRRMLCAGGIQPVEKECCICEVEEAEDKTAVLRCGHSWCEDFIMGLYNSVLRDCKSWPAKCCSPMEDGEANSLVDETALSRHTRIGVETSDPNASYCHQTAYGSYLLKTARDYKFRKCGSCNEETCTSCQMFRHTGACLQDEAAKTMKDVAKKRGWKHCPGCDALVERSVGCCHITCRCPEAALRDDRERRERRCAYNEHGPYFFVYGAGICVRCQWNATTFLGRCRRCNYGGIWRRCADVERFEDNFSSDDDDW